MQTWTLLLAILLTTVVMVTVAQEQEEETGNWFDNLIEEYKRIPRPPPRHTSKQMCIPYGKPCIIKNHQHNCCRGMGCYSGSSKDCYTRSLDDTDCACRRWPELKYVYYHV